MKNRKDGHKKSTILSVTFECSSILEFLFNFNLREGLDDVANLDVVEVNQ